MPHRDDLEAAHARIAALERELASAKNQDRNRFRCGRCSEAFGPGDLAKAEGELRCRRCTARLNLMRPGRPPRGLLVEEGPDRLRIAWDWRLSAAELILFIISASAVVFFILTAGAGDPKAVVAQFFLGGFALFVAFRLIGQLVNRTVVEVSGDQLHVQSGPLSLRAPPSLSRDEIVQLFCVAMPRGQGISYEVHAQLSGGATAWLVLGIDDPERAFYLERAIEERLGIVDRPVEGEMPPPGRGG